MSLDIKNTQKEKEQTVVIDLLTNILFELKKMNQHLEIMTEVELDNNYEE